jgi:7-cyano-7-deazaguanine synthase
MKPNGVAIVSGGLDSVTLLHHLVEKMGAHPHVVSFDYGQRHKKELAYAQKAAMRFGLTWSLIDLGSVGKLLANSSSLVPGPEGTLPMAVPEGHYSDETMRLTVVPNRNMVMASIATSICIAEFGNWIAAGPHNGDAAVYPDCRPVFWHVLEDTIRTGNSGGFLQAGWEIKLPFIHWTKTDIAHEAKRLGVPVEETWSCYKGEEIHCGRCGTCVERLEALDEAKVDDKTPYADTTFWKKQVQF